MQEKKRRETELFLPKNMYLTYIGVFKNNKTFSLFHNYFVSEVFFCSAVLQQMEQGMERVQVSREES